MPPLFQSRFFSVTRCVSTFRSTSVLIILSDKLRELWIIPIFFALVSGVSLVVAWLLGSLFRLDRPHRCDSFELSFISLKTRKPSSPQELRHGCSHDHELEFSPCGPSSIPCSHSSGAST